MKWLVVILIVVNLAAYLLVGGRQNPLETVRPDSGSDVNKTGMLLLAEVDSLQAAAADGESVADDTASDTGAVIAGDTPDPAVAPAGNSIDGNGDQPADKACYRLGPFRQEDSWQAAKAWMEESGFGFRPVTGGSRQLLAFRVYLGPFASEQSVDAMLKRLESGGLEHFRYTAENGLTRISMGLFSQEELAEKYLDYLASNQFEAKFQPEYRHLGPLNWMEITSADMDRAQVSGHDWGESGVGMAPVNCRI